MNDSAYIYEITNENFSDVVLEGSHKQPVLVDFWASWCQPCQMLMPVLSQLAKDYQGKFILAKINTEELQEITSQFGIRSIPALKLFVDGNVVGELTGASPESEIRDLLDKFTGSAENNIVSIAQKMIEAGNIQDAINILESAQSEDPKNSQILLALAQAQFLKGDLDAANYALDALPFEDHNSSEVGALRGQIYFANLAPAPDEISLLEAKLSGSQRDSEALYKTALSAVIDKDHEKGIELLLELMSSDPSYNNGAARQALLKIFEMLGEDPLVAGARKRMFNLLH
tara:strand:- start:1299 stop:2159 length:861 start_codon:yes stop_codon:yes gene_type:complete